MHWYPRQPPPPQYIGSTERERERGEEEEEEEAINLKARIRATNQRCRSEKADRVSRRRVQVTSDLGLV